MQVCGCAENIITGNRCFLIDVDTWQGSDEPDHEALDFDDVFEVYKSTVKPYMGMIYSYDSNTTSFLQSVRKDLEYRESAVYG